MHIYSKVFGLVSLLVFVSSIVLAGNITRQRTIEEFFKENTQLRISQGAVDEYQDVLNQMSLQVIKKAEIFSTQEKRKTVLRRDITKSSDEVFRLSPVEVPELMEKITQLSIIELADLTKRINVYSDKILENPD